MSIKKRSRLLIPFTFSEFQAWLLTVMVIGAGAVLLAVAASCGDDGAASASIEPTTRTIYWEVVEPKGTANIEKEPFPTESLPAGSGYVLKEPDEEGNWVVEVYVWKDSQIVVNQGDTVNLEIIGVNGERHPSFIEEYVDEFVVERGKLTSLSFLADQPGVFRIVCTVHQPTMTAELVVLPRP